MHHLRRALLVAATVAVAATVGLPAQPATALPGVCGNGHVRDVQWPGDHCTPEGCSGVTAGPFTAEPTLSLYVCVLF